MWITIHTGLAFARFGRQGRGVFQACPSCVSSAPSPLAPHMSINAPHMSTNKTYPHWLPTGLALHRATKKGAAAPLFSIRGHDGHQLRLQCNCSPATQAWATRPLSLSSSHAVPTCSRHFLALVDSEPHISRKVSSFNGNGSLCEAK